MDTPPTEVSAPLKFLQTLKQLFSHKYHHLTPEERLIRGLIHFPMGVLNGYLLEKHPRTGSAAFIAFIVYEIQEHNEIRDQAYPDLIGHLAGLPVYAIYQSIRHRGPTTHEHTTLHQARKVPTHGKR